MGDHTYCRFEAGCGCEFELFHDKDCHVVGAAAMNCSAEHIEWIRIVISATTGAQMLKVNFMPLSNN